MKRTVTRREIYPYGADIEKTLHPIDLALVAWAGAVETLQIDLVAKGWVNLFSALLVPGSNTSPLVWSAGGPGGEAEVKRAYSALFGRFFGRAVLRWEHNCLWLRQVRDGMTLGPGIGLHKLWPGLKGDLPDWVGWSPGQGCFTICEAKGSYEQASWSGRVPPIIEAATQQLDRVRVLDTGGRLQTKDWVVASRWGTENNGKDTTVITKDPLTEGRVLGRDESERVGAEAYAFWLADLFDGLDRPSIAKRLRTAEQKDDPEAFDFAKLFGREVYAALAVDGLGVISLQGPARQDRAARVQSLAEQLGRKVAVIAIDVETVFAALSRSLDPEPTAFVGDTTAILDGVAFSLEVEELTF